MSDAGPGDVRAAFEWLREGRAGLGALSDDDLTEAVAAVFEGFRDRSTPWRRRLEEALPEAAGFHPATVARGLDDALRGFTRGAVRAMAVREREIARAGHASVSGFECTAVVLGGAIPMPSLLSCTLPLLLRSPVLAKTASRDPVTAPLLAAALADADPRLGRCLAVLSFAGEDVEATGALLAAPCVVATGSDETLDRIAARLEPEQRLVRYGHRLSLAVVGPAAHADRVAAGIALDVARWDQQGCLSPLAVYAVGRDAGPLAAALARALDRLAGELPRGPVPLGAAAAYAHERAEAELRAAEGRAGLHLARDAVVVAEADARWRPAPSHRFVRVHPVADARQLSAALAPVARHLAGVSLDGFAPAEEARLEGELARLGASRVCAAGDLQAPPIDWHRDGMPLLAPLARPAGHG